MKLKNILINIITIVVVIWTLISCDDDLNSVGSEVIGDVNFETNQYVTEPISYSAVLEKVRTNGLPGNLLGVYNDPVYGFSTYSVLSQIAPSSGIYNPTFGREPVLDSVVFSLPYFSTIESTVTDAETGEIATTYELDSIYNGSNEAITLSLYRSDYFLRDLDPDLADPDDPDSAFEDTQLYYSDDITNFGLSDLTESNENFIFSVDSFIPSNEELILVAPDSEDDDDEDEEITKVSPRLRVALISDLAADTFNETRGEKEERFGNQEVIDQFTEWFIEKEGSSELSNANNFRNYFRGIYIKAETTFQGIENLMYINLGSANITLHYTFQAEDTENENDVPIEYIDDTGELAFSFSNNIVNGIENVFETSILDQLNKEQDTINGEDKLYLKGGEGSYAIIDLFNRSVETDADGDYILDESGNPVFKDVSEEGDKTELDFLRDQEWLINDAFIKFYIDRSQVASGDAEPERIYIFDAETGSILIDYSDDTQDTTDPTNSIINHLGGISSDDNGSYYQIRLTRHIINVLNLEGDNVKLGVAVSQNVNTTAIASGFTVDDDEEDVIVPSSSVISHEGTVLYGNGVNVPENVKLELQISYTKLKSN
ncbi:DUF4270 domain-containing protein [Aquimarina addita]|uniref:DUF4270 domain-containing protein n=1 Tax=Aquimarina addita TaxID=870485 RepID=A0ABP7XHZ5_9FLAO